MATMTLKQDLLCAWSGRLAFFDIPIFYKVKQREVNWVRGKCPIVFNASELPIRLCIVANAPAGKIVSNYADGG